MILKDVSPIVGWRSHIEEVVDAWNDDNALANIAADKMAPLEELVIEGFPVKRSEDTLNIESAWKQLNQT